MKRLLAFALSTATFLGASTGHACIWTYGTDLKGKQVQVGGYIGQDFVRVMGQHETREWWARQKKRLGENIQPGDYNRQNDLAAALLHLGEIEKAIAILARIENQKPGKYATAANLGTAYELQGNNRGALNWTREGIRRNHDAHSGTEWLHVRILEAKIALRKDPSWLKSHSVLALDFGTAPEPRMPRTFPKGNSGAALDAEQVKKAIFYQLRERLEFTTRPDPIVADLLFDLGNLLVLTDMLESAAAVYSFALEFTPVNQQAVQKRLQYVKSFLREKR